MTTHTSTILSMYDNLNEDVQKIILSYAGIISNDVFRICLSKNSKLTNKEHFKQFYTIVRVKLFENNLEALLMYIRWINRVDANFIFNHFLVIIYPSVNINLKLKYKGRTFSTLRDYINTLQQHYNSRKCKTINY
uniref:Uncharacterized protein n=1 Tax=viral metagenome TaxID=1070528 RepID=A0A6C0JAH1_9ZZZZ